MGLDERLFAWAWRGLGRLRATARGDAGRDATVTLTPSRTRRLELLASVLAGTAIEIRTAEGVGGVQGDFLMLPATISTCPEAAANRAIYLYRIAYGVASRVRGHRAPPEPAIASLAALLAVPDTLAWLETRWPGARDLRLRCSEALLAALPPPRTPIDVLERCLLGSSPTAPGFADAVAWARAVLQDPPDPARLATALAATAAAMPCASGRHAPPLLFGLLPTPAPGPADAGPVPALAVAGSALPTGTERAAPPRDGVETTTAQEPEDGDQPLQHVFEKLFTAEEYQGGERHIDGDDDLADHAEALDELRLRQVVRSERPTSSIYRADLEGALAPDLIAAGTGSCEAILYPEWDPRRRRHRPAWCALRELQQLPRAAPDVVASHRAAVRRTHARELRALRAGVERFENRRDRCLRQRNGGEVDVDALVDHGAALRGCRTDGGRLDDARLFIARRRRRPEVATTILLDTSLSTDSWVEDRRVLDVARDSIFLLAEVCEPLPLDFEIAAFHSNTRHDCRYLRVKDRDESWAVARARLLALRPTGYTRMGPALRHATTRLRRTSARQRVLLLLGDGKPTDHDAYEGRVGVADVRQALREARRDGIHALALTVDREAGPRLPAMFGRDGYRVLRHPGALPGAILALHERLLR